MESKIVIFLFKILLKIFILFLNWEIKILDVYLITFFFVCWFVFGRVVGYNLFLLLFFYICKDMNDFCEIYMNNFF